MKKNLIYTGIIIVMCVVVIWLAVLLAWPAGAAYADGGDRSPCGGEELAFSSSSGRESGEREAPPKGNPFDWVSPWNPFLNDSEGSTPLDSPVHTGGAAKKAQTVERMRIYVPPVSGYDPGTDYMAHMVAAAEDGGEWAMAMGEVYEAQRNAKIKDLGLEYETTDFFGGDNAKTVLEKLREYIAPEPEREPERVYLGLYWITGYDTCAECCGKTDGITASGATATVGRTVAASSEFAFGTRLYIDGIGERVVEDRGGAIDGGRIDVLCEDHAECYAVTGWYDVWVIDEG